MEENKLIAHFMGVIVMYTECCACNKEIKIGESFRYTKSYDTYCNTADCSGDVATIGGSCLEDCWWIGDEKGEAYVLKDVKYDTSWDWLMPVVSKITRDEILIENEYRESIMDTVPYGLIEDTYKVVIEFIKDYNKNK